MHTHTRNCRRESDDTDTHTHPHAHSWSYVCTNTHTHLGVRHLSITHTISCVLEIWLMTTHTYTHPYPWPRLITCTITYFSFTFTGAFPLHACGVTRNWRTYFTSVRRVFLVETVVWQTVLWDIRVWRDRFLVFLMLLLRPTGSGCWSRSQCESGGQESTDWWCAADGASHRHAWVYIELWSCRRLIFCSRVNEHDKIRCGLLQSNDSVYYLLKLCI